MNITKSDVYWNYGATFLKIASSALLLPIILRIMPSETVGIWTIFITITAFANLLDFGFSPSFTRNVTYVFSGVSNLKTNGYETVNNESFTVDYGLLKGVISSMRWFYARLAVVLFIILITVGTFYIYSLLEKYSRNHTEVYIAWILLCFISTYNLFTLYYDSLLQGKGLIKRSKQIIILGQIVYLIIAILLILAGNGLIAIVSAQASSVIIVRWLSYKSFFNPEINEHLKSCTSRPRKEILKVISPNAVKIGLTMIGSFMVQRSSIIIGSLYLSLSDIASYGITMQLIGVISSLAIIYTSTYQPKIVNLRITQNTNAIKELYLKGLLVLLGTFLFGGLALIFFGNWGFNLIGSNTQLMSKTLIIAAIVVSCLEYNHSMAGSILLTKNEIPFFKASIISGLATIIILQVLFTYESWGIFTMIIAPGIAQGVYQNWKWPSVVFAELNINCNDLRHIQLNLK